ncbi:MAG TPA: hypothetical protein VK614_13690 [Allosphingosinicella sp.]|nr:hypothetical protein [Allosphingosinicella sp.]
MDENKLKSVVQHVSNELGGEKTSSGRAMLENLPHYAHLVEQAVAIETEDVEVLMPQLFSDDRPSLSTEFLVARQSRGGPPKSYKPTNITREVGKTVYVTLLLGMVVPAIAAATSPVVGPAALVIGLGYAAFNAISATVNYSDACVLHKAWKIAQERGSDWVTLQELVDVSGEIEAEYDAPKFASESEVRDSVKNLIGLRAMVADGDRLTLREKIVFFADGTIKE